MTKYLITALLFIGQCFASCTAANTTQAAVQACVNSEPRKGTVIVPAGSSTWSVPVTSTKGITITGAGVGQTNITLSGGSEAFQFTPDATAIANSNLATLCNGTSECIKVTGFQVDGGGSSAILIELNGASGITGTKPYCCYVIGDNKLQHCQVGTSSGVITAANGNADGQLRGVVYHNTIDKCDIIFRSFSNNDTREDDNTAFNSQIVNFDLTGLGTSDNLYFEDNTIQWSSATAGLANAGWTETGQGARFIQRYNTYNFANASGMLELNDVHGFQGWPGGNTGTMITERYGNNYNGFTGFRCLDFRGGVGIVFNNSFVSNCDLELYGESNTNFCPQFISPTPTYNPLALLYVFNNTNNSGEMNAQVTNFGGTFQCTITENNGNALGTHGAGSQGGWWNLNTGACTTSSCTAGIGRGTTAPTGTCTKGTGYWVSPTPTPTTSSAVIQASSFYVCTATNVWTLRYQPYTYPHPLRGAAPVTTTPTNFGGQIKFGGHIVIN